MEHGKKALDDDAPWLLITDGEQNEKQYMYSLSEDRVHPHHDPELEGGMIVLGSAYGWLVLSHPHPETYDTFLWNPISMDKIHLGTLLFSFAFEKCVMSKPPSEPDCNLVFFSTGGGWQSYWRVSGDRTVVNLSNPDGFDDHNNDEDVLAAAAFRGTVYGLLYPDFRFVVLHFGDEGVEYRTVLKEQRPWDMPDSSWEPGCCNEYHMIESQQEEEELLLVKSVRVSSQELDFRVFRVDVDRKECVELDNIGDRGIFLSFRAGGFCCCCCSSSSSGGFRPNCIYYTLKQGKSRCVFVYDMNDRSTSPLLPCPDASRTDSHFYWIQNQVFPTRTN